MSMWRAPPSQGNDGFGGSILASSSSPEMPPDDYDHHVPKPVYGVKEVTPVLGAPRTLQYKGMLHKMPMFPSMPSEQVSCEGWGRAAVKNLADWLDQSFADKYIEGMGDTEWHFIRIDGWILQFWNPDTWHPLATDSHEVLPAGWIDLRMVRGVGIDKLTGRWNIDCPCEVQVSCRSGYMSFFVRTEEEAAKWFEAIQAGFSEHQLNEEAKRARAAERAEDIHSRTVQIGEVVRGPGGVTLERGKDLLLHVAVDPARAELLRELWVKCVRASVGQGGTDMQGPFMDMYRIYDFDEDDNLRMDELEVMLKELLAVRWAEYQKALQEQEEVVLSHSRLQLNAAEEERTWRGSVGLLGDRLKIIYSDLMQEHGFQKRVAVLRGRLDISHDGIVTCEEFTEAAPQLMLPIQELQIEAKFYGHCSVALQKVTRLDRELRKLDPEAGSDSESSDEGCLQA